MKTKQCKTCKVELNPTNIHGGNLKKVSYCKGCFNEVMQKHRSKSKQWCVYHLPAEYYVGVTDYFVSRINNHKIKGKNVTDAHVIAEFDNPYDCLALEAKYHKMGYYGCQVSRSENRIHRTLY